VLEHRREGVEREESGTVVGAFLTRSGAWHRGKEGGRGVRGWAPRGGWKWERKRVPEHGGGWLGWLASSPGRWARAAALPCNSGGWRSASDVSAAADKWGPVGSS
jgi:hypothetical protein